MLAPETLDEIAAAVKAADRYGEPLRIFGSDSKAFYGRRVVGTPLSLRMLSGVIAYEPTELVVTVRAGTRIGDLEALLASEDQMLGCEPPHLGDDATIGGMIGTGLAGPRRPYAGGVRDSVLGIRCIVAGGSLLRFGAAPAA
ncbi:MAG: FAD-binding protein [Gammaproteobacteria bacterium]